MRPYNGVRNCSFQRCWTINGFGMTRKFFSASKTLRFKLLLIDRRGLERRLDIVFQRRHLFAADDDARILFNA
jgi:hypothetical protein